MSMKDLVIRIGGEAGEGVLSTGQLLAQAAARGGYKVVTYFSPPAEIKGGFSFFQMRLSAEALHTEGDAVDILIAFNQEAFDRSIKDLRPGGLVVYDTSVFNPPDEPERRQVGIPFSQIARTELKFELGKNVVAVGAISTLFGLPTEHTTRLLRERFEKKGPEILQKNYDALNAGSSYVDNNLPQRSDFSVDPGAPRPNDIVVSGNHMIGLGALSAGVRFFAGYPITPASDIMEFLAENLPKVGGTMIQAEDELSSIGMVLGASYAGKKAMTSTSGPGLSLMVEMLGLGSMAELPAVLVDAQRAGPSTGMPTRHEQGDLYLAAYGGHGDVPRIVLAPTSVEDCFYQAVNAFNLAERFQMPVILLQDTVLAVRTENVPKPDLGSLQVEHRLLYQPNGEEKFRRYDLGADEGISPMSVPGMPGGQYTATGLEHSERARPRYDEATHSQMTEKRFRKLEAARKHAPEALRYGTPGAAIAIVTWGSTAGSVMEAIDQASLDGLQVEMIAPKMLRPLPDHQLVPFLQDRRVILVPEVNYVGQFADMLTARYRGDYKRVNIYGGTAFKVRDLVRTIREAARDAGIQPEAGPIRASR